jgi:prefoldin alpha subunit
MDEKLLQRKYIQLQLLRQQLNALLEEKRLINEQVAELMVTINALQKLEYMKGGDEIWSTLGSNVFIRSDIKDTEKVFVGVGAGTVIKDTRENAIKILESRLNELNNVDKEVVTEINKFSEQINRLEPEFQKLQEGLEKEEKKSR